MDEKELISGLKNRDEESFKILVEVHKDRIYNLCFGYVRNANEAEDLAQEVFIAIYNSIEKFNSSSSLETWVYRIAINEALQFIRKQKAQKRFGFLYSLFGQEDKLGGYYKEEVHPGVALENKERSKVLFGAIDRLSENQQTAFLLSKVEGKSYEEVAEIMKNSVSAVESLLHRAKSNLKKNLANYYKNKEL
ncbi:MAG: RNA polymerase sigma factor [Bacteroidota bacterium]